MRGNIIAGLLAVAAVASSTQVAPVEEDGPDLFQLTPVNIKSVCDGTKKTVFAAFVNPYLPHSVAFHPVIHELNKRYQNRSDVLIAFGDVSIHRQFIKMYGLKDLPTIKIFDAYLPQKLPQQLEYRVNRTTEDYGREIEAHLHMADMLGKDTAPYATRVSEILVTAQKVQVEALKAAAAKKAAEPETTAEVTADGQQVNATDAASNSTEPTTAELLAAQVRALQDELTAHAEHIERMARISKERLQYLSTAIGNAANTEMGGVGLLARELNVKLRELTIGTDFVNTDARQSRLLEIALLRRLLDESTKTA